MAGLFPIKNFGQKLKTWTLIIIFSGIVTGLAFLYYNLTKEGATGNRLISQVTANSSMILIGVSFLISSLAYFKSKPFAKLLRFRQHIGLAGFYIFLLHLYITLESALNNPGRSFSDYHRVWSFTFGLIGTVIFFYMAIISNDTALKMLGTKAFRVILRTGYLAYFVVIIHLAIRKLAVWQKWQNGELPLPPLSLVITVFAFVVMLSRIILWLKLRKKVAPAPQII